MADENKNNLTDEEIEENEDVEDHEPNTFSTVGSSFHVAPSVFPSQ